MQGDTAQHHQSKTAKGRNKLPLGRIALASNKKSPTTKSSERAVFATFLEFPLFMLQR